MLMDVQVVRVVKAVAVVRYRDSSGMWQGRIIPSDTVMDRVGSIAHVSREILDAGTEYGYDWSVAFPDPLVISPEDLQQALRSHGIWTIEDLAAYPNQCIAALLSLVKVVHANMVRSMRESITTE